VGFEWLKRDVAGLVTVVVQDRQTGVVRMVAHADEAAVRATLDTGLGHFYSRSRQRPWKKGEESGHFLHVREVWSDCDADCLVYLVDADGPSCHTGADTCFYRRLGGDGTLEDLTPQLAAPTFPRLFAELEARRSAASSKSYTRSLLEGGPTKVAAKIREEGDELARAVEGESDERVVSESGDVFYHLLVGLLLRNLGLRDLAAEIARRFGVSGHEEKAARR
jgi:phosphoribosyl-AMP cyclohydrolase / phosphoribosyl-ATP pyrophosphohydrolase